MSIYLYDKNVHIIMDKNSTLLKRIEGVFLHGISLNDWYPCWNLSLCGWISSPDFTAIADQGIAEKHTSLRDIEIQQLKDGNIPSGVLTPRSIWYVWAYAIIISGGNVGIGRYDTYFFDEDDRQKILEMGDIELKFEEERRRISPESASRLCSLYVADNSEFGKHHIIEMFDEDTYIFEVTIPCALRFSKVDTKWFEKYRNDPNPEYIEKYWKSIPYDEDVPTWEYLVEGMIKVNNLEDIEHIRKNGVKPTNSIL